MQIENSQRTKNSIYNFLITLMGGIFLPVLGLIKYSMFINQYGGDINGLQITIFSILSILNIFELTFSLVFRQLLYKPLADRNQLEVNLIYSGTVKIFRITGVSVLITGTCIALVFPHFASSPLSYFETVSSFLLLLLPFALSYFLMGPNFILIADQKEYKISIWIQIISIIRVLLMIIVIKLKMPVFVVFLIESLQIIVANIIAKKIALKNYPWLHVDKSIGINKIFFKNIQYALMQRISILATNGIDSIIISISNGFLVTSIFGAYNYVTDTIYKIINASLNSVINSFGNLFNNSEKNSYCVFLEFYNFAIFIASFIGIMVFLLLEQFITIWLKQGNQYNVSLLLTCILSINVFYMIQREVIIMVRDANGLFTKAQKNAVIYTSVKIILSIALIYKLGILGALLSTLIVNWTIDFLYNPNLVYRSVFKEPTFKYYQMILSRITIVLGIAIFTYFLKTYILQFPSTTIIDFVISCVILSGIVMTQLLFIYLLFIADFRRLLKRLFNIVKMNKRFRRIWR